MRTLPRLERLAGVAAAAGLALSLTGCWQAITNPGNMARWDEAMRAHDFIDVQSSTEMLNGIDDLDASALIAISPEITDEQIEQISATSCAHAFDADLTILVDEGAGEGSRPTVADDLGDLDRVSRIGSGLCFSPETLRAFVDYFELGAQESPVPTVDWGEEDAVVIATTEGDGEDQVFRSFRTNAPLLFDILRGAAQNGEIAISDDYFNLTQFRRDDGTGSGVDWRISTTVRGEERFSLSPEAREQADNLAAELDAREAEVLAAVTDFLDGYGVETDSMTFSDDGRFLTIVLSADNRIAEGFTLEDVSREVFRELSGRSDLLDVDFIVTYPGDPDF